MSEQSPAYKSEPQGLNFDSGTRLAQTGVAAEAKVVTGTDIATTIIEASREYNLIVIGASNEWVLRQRLFGSIPDQVADKAMVSVLMVRSEQ